MATDTPDDRGDDGTDPADAFPRTGIEVHSHFHFGMTGSFPLRLAELFFADDGLYIAEYAYVTPFIGLTARKHRREAGAMARLYEEYGLDAVLLEADSFVWHDYDNIDRVDVYDGGWFGRPKVAVYPTEGPSHAYRFHDRPAFEESAADLETDAPSRALPVERHDGLGFTPIESLKRFFHRE